MNTKGNKVGWVGVIKSELALWVGIFAVLVFYTSGPALLGSDGNPWSAAASFVAIFGIMLWLSFGVVHHAECLAVKLGEPYGTLILTLSVISIEVVMICALMLNGSENPTLARDTMFSVLMIVLNGMLGLTLLLGGLRHHRQVFNLEGARSYLIVLLCLSFLALVLPTFSRTGGVGSASLMVFGFVALASIGLYGIFLFLQSTRHRDFFEHPAEEGESSGDHAHGPLEARSTAYHAVFLILSLLPIVLLSKKIAVLLEFGISALQAPQALAGFVVALLVLAPEGLAACKAALQNTLQRSVNIVLGSALATIGLTVPAALAISAITSKHIILGLGPVELVLLIATFFSSVLVFAGNRTNMLAGAVHLVLFAAYAVLIFD
ncbi:MAG: calcium:proton antiporter [Spartobacteria bacterium]